MTTIYMTKGDLLPSIQATLKYLDGTVVDLTDATTVVFNLKKENGDVVFSGGTAFVNSSAGAGIVQYDWQEGDTDVEGVCFAEFVVTFSNGSSGELSFPAKGDFQIRFRPRLDS